MLGDVHIGEPGALIGFAGPRVIEQTVRETLPEGFQRSEFLLEHGALDMIVDRRQLRDKISSLCTMLMGQGRLPRIPPDSFTPNLIRLLCDLTPSTSGWNGSWFYMIKPSI